MKYFILIFVACCVACGLRAQGLQAIAEQTQPVTVFRFGVFADAAKNFHQSQAHVFCCEDGCGVFGNGTGSGFHIGILAERPLVRMLDITASVGYAERGGDFGVARVGNMPVLDVASGKYVTLQRQHSYTATLPEVVAMAGVRFTPLQKIPIYIVAGLTYTMPLSSSSNYKQTEEILSPSGVVYPETHTTEKTIGSGEIQLLNSTFGALGSIGYPLPLSHDITFAPEVRYSYPFTKVRSDFNWKIASLEGGVAIRYNIYKSEPAPPPPPPPPPPPAPTPKPKPEPPIVEVALASPQQVQVVETIVTETFPLLPYIFFDSANSALQPRYEQIASSDRARFRDRELPHNSLEAYYQILDVLGDRLTSDPSKTIVITGTTDGKETEAGKPATSLAKDRAETVKQYLTSVWGIEPGRITTKTASTPSNPSSKKYAEGIEENRRVEISSGDEKMLEPVVHEKFSRYEGTPKQLSFVLNASSKQSEITSWEFKVSAGSEIVYHATGSSAPPKSFDWSIGDKDLGPIAKAAEQNQDLKATLTVTDAGGLTTSSSYNVPKSKSRFPFELSRLSLVVFDFDRSDISAQNKKMVQTFVAKSIKEESEARITGSTDRLGELDHNQELSQARADAVATLVKQDNPNAKLTEVKGIGPAESTDMNSSPEGRYYCRTVTVQVQTPLQ